MKKLMGGVFSFLLKAGAVLVMAVFGDLSVRAIAQDQEVTVHGTVEVVDGVPVLRAPEGAPFVVSPMPFDEVLEQAERSGTIDLVFGWLLLAGAAALAFFSLRGWLRGRRGAAAA
jgi:hypothetical protein